MNNSPIFLEADAAAAAAPDLTAETEAEAEEATLCWKDRGMRAARGSHAWSLG